MPGDLPNTASPVSDENRPTLTTTSQLLTAPSSLPRHLRIKQQAEMMAALREKQQLPIEQIIAKLTAFERISSDLDTDAVFFEAFLREFQSYISPNINRLTEHFKQHPELKEKQLFEEYVDYRNLRLMLNQMPSTLPQEAEDILSTTCIIIYGHWQPGYYTLRKKIFDEASLSFQQYFDDNLDDKTGLLLCFCLASRDEEAQAIFQSEKMNSFWEQKLKKYYPRNPYYHHAQTIACYKTYINLCSLEKEITSLPISEFKQRLFKLGYNVNKLFTVQSEHFNIRDKLITPEEQVDNLLLEAIKLLENDSSLSDTSSLFPDTLTAQYIHGPAAVVNEAMNKIAIANSFLNLYAKQEDDEQSFIIAQYARQYALRAYHDICLAEELSKPEFNYTEATYDVTGGDPAYSTFKFEGLPPESINSWTSLKQFCKQQLDHRYGWDLSEAEISRIEHEATKISAKKFLPEKHGERNSKSPILLRAGHPISIKA